MSEVSGSSSVERIVSYREEYTRLLILAAKIAQRNGMPDIETWRWPSRIPRALYRDARFAEHRANETCAEWAIEIRQIADAIVAANRKAIDEALKANTVLSRAAGSAEGCDSGAGVGSDT